MIAWPYLHILCLLFLYSKDPAIFTLFLHSLSTHYSILQQQNLSGVFWKIVFAMWMSMNGNCQERHLLVSKSFCKMQRLLMVSYPASALLPRSAEIEKNPMTCYTNTFIIFNCIFICIKLLWVALTKTSPSNILPPPKKSLLRMSPTKPPRQKKWHLWTSGRHSPPLTIHLNDFTISQPLNLDKFLTESTLMERPPCVLPLPSFLSPMRLLAPKWLHLGGVFFFSVFPWRSW